MPEKQSEKQSRVTTVFLLGWAISETLGRLRQGVRPPAVPPTPSADNAPRLIVSDGDVEKSTDAFLFSAQRIVQFYAELGFEEKDSVSPLTVEIQTLPQKIADWLGGKSTQFYNQRELRDLLNSWSVQVWARLNAESAEAARAFTAGTSLADTYWYLRFPRQRPKGLKPGQLSQEDWRRLLSKYRLDVERSRLQSLAGYLPRYVVAVLSKQLQAWSVGTQLVYRDSKLQRDETIKESAALKPEDEAKLYQALARQVQNWEAMLFGLREASTFLWSSDHFWIPFWRRAGLFVVLLATALLLVVVTGAIGYMLALVPLPLLLQFLAQKNAGASDYLAVVGLLWTALIAVPVPLVLRAVYLGTREVQQRLDDWLIVRYITKRTYVPWDNYLGKRKSHKDQAV